MEKISPKGIETGEENGDRGAKTREIDAVMKRVNGIGSLTRR